MANPVKLVKIELSELGRSGQSDNFSPAAFKKIMVRDELVAGLDGQGCGLRSVLFWQGTPLEIIDIEGVRLGQQGEISKEALTEAGLLDLYDRFLQSVFPHSEASIGREMMRQRLLWRQGDDRPGSWILDPGQRLYENLAEKADPVSENLAENFSENLAEKAKDQSPAQSSLTIAVCIRAKTAPNEANLHHLLMHLKQQHSVVQILVVEYGGSTAMVRSAVRSAVSLVPQAAVVEASVEAVEASVKTPVEAVVEASVKTPVETPVEASVKTPVETPVEYYQVDRDTLGFAQQVALEKSRGDIVGFVGDRTWVDGGWSRAIGRLFDQNSDLNLVTGLTLPQSLGQERQAWCEAMYGQSHGLTRQWICWSDPSSQPKWTELGVMQYGSDVNFAVRRSAFQPMSPNPILDGLNAPLAGWAWPWMTRELLQGKTLVYEPRAIVQIEVPAVDRDIEGKAYGEVRSFYRYLKWVIQTYPALRSQVLILGLWKLSRVLGAYIKGYGLPRSWFRSELRGIWDEQLDRQISGRRTRSGPDRQQFLKPSPALKPAIKAGQVEILDLSQPLQPIQTDAILLRLYVKWCDRLLGYVEIPSHGHTIGIDRIADVLVDRFFIQLLSIPYDDNSAKAWSEFQQSLRTFFSPPPVSESTTKSPVLDHLPNHIPVSIIIPTCNRPHDLRNCLTYLHQVKTDRPLEIIVVDNRPQAKVVADVLRDFPKVKLIEEARPGSSYARNAAIVASTGDIVVTIDDDVSVPADWLEKLLVPFTRPEVMSVCGGVLPLVLDTPAQLMFEQVKGGLCFGYEKREADRNWLMSFTHGVPPIWELGVSANSAFRSQIFTDPSIGLMEETLGAGMPTAGAEENHYSYKILRAGHTIVYDPSAYVWHHHRQTLKAFYKQVQGQMISCPALNLTLWLKEGDRRGRQQLLWNMPRYFWQCWRDRLLGKTQTPWKILFYEFKGYLMGFPGYFQSQKMVQQQGRSAPYIPPDDR